MKNTKLTEGLDQSTQQDVTSQSKRKILTSIGVSSSILGASALSNQWAKPIVNSIILPAHAQTTPGDMMTTDAPTTTMMATTMMPEPMSRIMVSTDNMGTIGDGNTGTAGAATYQIRLSEIPSNDVTVTVTASPAASVVVDTDPTAGASTAPHTLTFTLNNFDTWQPVTVTAAAEDVDDDTEVTIKFKASGGGYDEEKSVMVTVVNDDVVSPSMVMVEATETNSGGGTNGSVMVSWKAPDTTATVLYYLVHQGSSAIGDTTPGVSDTDVQAGPGATSAVVGGLAAGTYHFAVTAAFKIADGTTSFETAQAGGTTSTAITIN